MVKHAARKCIGELAECHLYIYQNIFLFDSSLIPVIVGKTVLFMGPPPKRFILE